MLSTVISTVYSMSKHNCSKYEYFWKAGAFLFSFLLKTDAKGWVGCYNKNILNEFHMTRDYTYTRLVDRVFLKHVDHQDLDQQERNEKSSCCCRRGCILSCCSSCFSHQPMVNYVVRMVDFIRVVVDIRRVRVRRVLDTLVGYAVRWMGLGGVVRVEVWPQQGGWVRSPGLIPPGHIDSCGWLGAGVVSHLECHLHVVGGAVAAGLAVQVTARRRRDEVVVLARFELHPAWGGGERPECDGKVHQLLRLVADGDDARVGAGDPTRVVLFFGHGVDDVALRVGVARPVHRADDVDLVVLPWLVALVDVDDVVCVVDPENWI